MSAHPPDGVVTLDNTQLPVLVLLARGAGPDTLQIVDPDDPQSVLGKTVTRIYSDVSLTTQEPLGEPIDRIFPWLAADLEARRSYTPVAQIPGGRIGRVELDPTDFQYRSINY